MELLVKLNPLAWLDWMDDMAYALLEGSRSSEVTTVFGMDRVLRSEGRLPKISDD